MKFPILFEAMEQNFRALYWGEAGRGGINLKRGVVEFYGRMYFVNFRINRDGKASGVRRIDVGRTVKARLPGLAVLGRKNFCRHYCFKNFFALSTSKL